MAEQPVDGVVALERDALRDPHVLGIGLGNRSAADREVVFDELDA